MKHLLVFFALLAFSCGQIFAGEIAKATEMVLVEKGVCRAPIIVATNAPANTVEAAKELAVYVEKISGARPALLSGAPAFAPASAIWVGFQPAMTEVFRDVSFEFGKPEEILLTCDGRHLAIVGRDRVLGDKQTESGTANAVYTFLQRNLGVRWLWPGPLGEDIVKRDTLALAPFTYRFHPPIRHRKMWRSSFGGSRADEWFRRQRLELGSLHYNAGHAFTSWWEKYHEAHPDYFAQQPDGSRAPFPKPDDVKICVSNPRVWAQWLDNAVEMLRADPTRTMFSASPNDGALSGHCVCANCRAWDHPDGAKVTLRGKGGSAECVMLTDRYVKSASILARGLRERLPGREVFVGLHAYGPYTAPPVAEIPDRNVAISYVGFFPLTTEASRQQQKEQWKAWSAKASMMIYRPNLWYWAGGVWGLPEVAMTKTIEDFRFLAQNRCVGLSVDTWRQNWATQGPQYYLMAALAYDPLQDGATVLRDYYRRGFGSAAGEVEKYWTLMETARDKVVAIPGFQLGSRNRFKLPAHFQQTYTDDLLNGANAMLCKAEAKVANGPEVYRQRVAFVRSGLEFTRLMIQSIPVMAKARESRGKDTGAVRRGIEIWDTIEKLCRQAGPFALNYGNVLNSMRGKLYMGGMQDYFGPPSEKLRAAAGIK